MIGVIPGQMVLDLFPKEREPSPLERCVSHLVSRGCDEARVRPMVEELYGLFGTSEAYDRAACLGYFFGDRAVPRLRACPPSMIGLFDRSIDYHVVWDRCWAARWAPLIDVFEVREWRYNYRRPYTGAPVFIWYIDNKERELAIDGLRDLVQTGDVNWPTLMLSLGAASRERVISRICELADPSAWKLTVADNERLLDRCRELEAENTRLKASLAKGDAR